MEDKILKTINSFETIETLEIARLLNVDHQKIIGFIKSLESFTKFINVQPMSCKNITLTPEGLEIAQNGSYEAILYNSIPLNGISQKDLMENVKNYKIGFSKAMSFGWIKLDKSNEPTIYRQVDSIVDQVQQWLLKIKDSIVEDIPSNLKHEFKRRKLITENLVKSYRVSKGLEFKLKIDKEITDLSPEMIEGDLWKDVTFKKYNFKALGVSPSSGHFHPLMKVKTQFRQIFLEMGFSEMATNNYIESSFWNFDALFQPQNHPARDEHDTFFLSDPKNCLDIPLEYLKKVKKIHTHGGFGSLGYQYDWKTEEAQKNILRTHTTADNFKPCKYFSIDKVYRNENLDATHLAEFHQIEGIIADYDLSLGHLMGVLKEFYKKLGLTKLRFKPTYNPYTEPSMEIYSYHDGLNKWVEIGNSGIFRPEMLLPMGLPTNISVIAWGLSLERPTMILYGISNIRELVGHKVNLQMVYESPICFFK
ncbi:phenylalanine--tRNA ligase alpha subunit-like isoform X2 [Gordionus sp. m RMFG-2023]|uniref:phenylalanine--tRNA ligase alpha subunit-like isoform X2 n=1 Tax=Gordionus sp. m RMFG-2023 TaxID=3053472 RepID=UPI0031FC5B9D